MSMKISLEYSSSNTRTICYVMVKC
jgi:hypothetical protein